MGRLSTAIVLTALFGHAGIGPRYWISGAEWDGVAGDSKPISAGSKEPGSARIAALVPCLPVLRVLLLTMSKSIQEIS